MNKYERDLYLDLIKQADQFNCAVTLARRSSSNHPIWEIRHRKSGRTRNLVTSSTSSSNSGRLNALCEAKRIMRQLKVPVPQ